MQRVLGQVGLALLQLHRVAHLKGVKSRRAWEDRTTNFPPKNISLASPRLCWMAGAKLIGEAKAQGKQAFIYVNNRLAENALEPIGAMVEALGG